MKKLLGFFAMAGLMAIAAPAERAQALTLISPASGLASKTLSNNLTVEVRHGGGGFRGGGFRGGGFHGGGFRGGGFRGGGMHIYRAGGPRFGRGYVGRPHFVNRPHYAYRPHYYGPRRHFAPRRYWRPRPYIYPGYAYVAPRLHCRRVWTDFGPRRICRYRPWW
ncbi:MAG: hypothetical protein R3D69_01165 [Xanthobacteraceae bacterium]